MVRSHQEASKIRHTHTETNKVHSRRTTCHVLLRFICLPAHKDPSSEYKKNNIAHGKMGDLRSRRQVTKNQEFFF